MPKFKQYLFDRELNPGINFFERTSLWAFEHIPELHTYAIVRIIGFVYCFLLLGWLIVEGVTFQGIIVRGLLITLFFMLAYLKTIACLLWVVLFKWEKFK